MPVLKRNTLAEALSRGLGLLPLPESLLRTFFRVLLLAAGGRKPESALRCLLRLETDLANMLDIVAVRYDGGVHAKHRLTRYHAFFIERLRPGERVLDIGCGNGALARDLAVTAGAVVTGIDIDAENIAKAIRQPAHPNLRFLQGDATRELPEGAYDAMVLSNVLEHLKDRENFLRTMVRRARPARLLIRVPLLERHWTVPLRQELGLFHYCDATHETEYTEASFATEMAGAGLALTEIQIHWGEIWAVAEPLRDTA